MIDLGTVRPGTTIYIPFATYDSNDPSASVTLTGLAVTDIEIYKDGGTTQRGSDNGYALLDTDGIDFDGVTGIHGFSINLADNTTAGFYSAGGQYWVVVASVTVDSGVVNFIAATFRIGYPDAVLNTTIATLASQTSFTLTAGPEDDHALVGAVVVVHDVASAVQIAQGVVSAYTGSSKTVTLAFDPAIFTMAAGDNIAFFPGVNVRAIAQGKTAADNLKTAADNYSATRGLTGTAVPAAAAGAADGLILGSAANKLAVDAGGKVAVPDTQKVDVETVKTRAVGDVGVGNTLHGLQSADTGATAVFRTGADSDTGETLSDQIDAFLVADVYDAVLSYEVHDSAATAADEYTVIWYKNGVASTDASAVKIQVTKRSDGTDQIAEASMSQIGATATWKYDSTAARLVPGLAYVAILTATIDAETQTVVTMVGRDG